MKLDLENKTVLITGASRGIGRAIADVFAAEGSRLILVSRVEQNLSEARDHIVKMIPDAIVAIHAADLRDAKMIDELVRYYGDVDILVNNAGAVQQGYLLDLPDDAWVDGWNLKVFGQIRMTRGFYKSMKMRGSGIIINVIGNAGERPLASSIAQSAGNAALMAFTKIVGATSPADGIRVVGINPGPTLTDRLRKRLQNRATVELGSSERWVEFIPDYPFSRAAHPEEIAYTAAFLASSKAGYITGTIVTVDGGLANRTMVV